MNFELNKFNILFFCIFIFFDNQCGKPNFFILGFPKCGTTSLFFYLKEHPQIIQGSTKEIKGLKTIDISLKHRLAYEKNFPEVKQNELTFSASPVDIFVNPEIVKKYYPDAKLIIMIRNPVDRFFSHYQMNKILHKKDKPLQEYVSIVNDVQPLIPWHKFQHSMLGMGHYAKIMKPWFQEFDKNQILVIVFEDFFMEPSKHMASVFNFLELPNYKDIEFSNYSKLWYHYDDKMEYQYQNFFSNYYYESNLELEALLERKLNWNDHANPPLF